MKIKFSVLMLTLPLSFYLSADSRASSFYTDRMAGEISAGTISGETRERVYDPNSGGRKISQLDWKYQNASVIKVAADWDILPALSLGFSGWTTFASHGGYMKDRDWSQENAPHKLTDTSWHPATRLNFANEVDVNIKGWLLNAPMYRLGVMAGYQERRFSFNATGGTYHYTNEETGLPDTGEFAKGERVIGYKQTFRMPYVGLIGSYRYQNLEFGGTLKYSDWVNASDNDEHYARKITYKGTFKNQTSLSLSGHAGYYILPLTKVFIEGNWNRTLNKRGDVDMMNYENGERDRLKDTGGIESHSFMTVLGLRHTF